MNSYGKLLGEPPNHYNCRSSIVYDEASKAIDEFAEALRRISIKTQKDIYFSWLTPPDRKDNLN